MSAVTVTQADRDAATMFRAEALRSLMAGEPGGWKDTPDDKLVQAFARHRIQSQTVSTGEIGELVEQLRWFAWWIKPGGGSFGEGPRGRPPYAQEKCEIIDKAVHALERLSALSGEGG